MHADDLVRPPATFVGESVERLFAGRDLLAGLGRDEDIVSLTLVPAPGTVVIERSRPSGERERCRLSADAGLPLPSRLPAACVFVLAALDGRRSVGEAVTDASSRTGVSYDALAAECLPVLAALLGRGQLVQAQP